MTHTLKKKIALLTLLTLLGVSINLVLPTTTAQEGQAKYGGTLVVALNAEPRGFTPWNVHTPSSDVASQVLESTFAFPYVPLGGEFPKPMGVLVKSWEKSADGLTYTFHLVDNATWHDGVKFTADDIVFTIETLKTKQAWSGGAFLNVIENMTTPDEYTVVFELTKPYASFIADQWPRDGLVIPKHIFEGTDVLTNPAVYEPIGTGAFKFAEYVAGDYLKLVKNENYWKEGLPYLDEVIYKIITDPVARVNALLAGEVDYSIDVHFSQVPRVVLDSNSEIQFYSYVGVNPYGLGMNTRDPILSNKKVRQAIAWAIDDEKFISLGVGGYGGPSPQLFTAHGIPNGVDYWGRDLEKANKLLDEAGYPKGAGGIRFDLTHIYSVERAAADKMSETIKDDLADVGINVILRGVTDIAWINSVWKTLDYQLSVYSIIIGPDISRSYNGLHSDWIGQGGWTNGMGYNNTEVDDLLDQVLIEPSEENAQQMWGQIQEIFQEELPFLPIVIWYKNTAWRKDFHGFPNDVMLGRASFATIWWEGGTEGAAALEPIWTYIAIGVAVVIVGSAVVGAYLWRRRR